VAAYCGPAYADVLDGVEAMLTGIEGIDVAMIGRLSALDPAEPRTDDLTIVCADSEENALPDGPTIRVTTDPAVVRTATNRGALDVIAWGPTDDSDLLAAQLRRRLAVVGESTDTDSPTASKRVDDGVATVDGNGNITYHDETVAALLERPGTSLVGEQLWTTSAIRCPANSGRCASASGPKGPPSRRRSASTRRGNGSS
jgi:PAS domain-containing protein